MILANRHRRVGAIQPVHLDLLRAIAVNGAKRSSAIAFLFLTEQLERGVNGITLPQLLGLFFYRCLVGAKSEQTNGDSLAIRAEADDAATRFVSSELSLSSQYLNDIVFRPSSIRRVLLDWLCDEDRYIVPDTWSFDSSMSDAPTRVARELAYKVIPRELTQKHYEFLFSRKSTVGIVLVSDRGRRSTAVTHR
jgi:hypothetical protein